MATNQNSQPIDADVREHLDAIDGSLHEQLEQDARLTSGVPDDQRGDDLGFIQMSGLTRPRLAEPPATPSVREDLDPSRPVNFFEAGVEDVDASMDPGSYDSAAADSEDLGIAGAPSETAKGLREILAQLGSEGAVTEPSPEDEPPAPPLSVEDTLDAQSLVDAGGAALLRREIELDAPTDPAPAATPIETEPAVDEAPADPPEGSTSEDLPAVDAIEGDDSTVELSEDAVTAALLASLDGDGAPEMEPEAEAALEWNDSAESLEPGDVDDEPEALGTAAELSEDAVTAALLVSPESDDAPEAGGAESEAGEWTTSEEPTPQADETHFEEAETTLADDVPAPEDDIATEEIPTVTEAPHADVENEVDGDSYEAAGADLEFLQTPSIDESLRQNLDAPEPAVEPEPVQEVELAVETDPVQEVELAVEADPVQEAEPVVKPDPHAAEPIEALFGGARLNGDWSGRLYQDAEPMVDDAPAAVIGANAPPEPELDPPASSSSWLQPQEGPLLARRQHRRSKSRRRNLRRRIRRWAIRGMAAVIFLCALGAVAWAVRDMLQPPITLYMEAQRLSSEGRYWEASQRYEMFASRNPGDALRPAAEFEAAQVLANIAPAGQDERTEVNRRRLALYQSFVENNPGHPKVARATRLIGQLQFELGQYEDVIRNYRPELQVQDPASALPALRLLARAYDQLGEAEQAESAFLRASSMEGNLSPERDYEALADLHHRLAEGAADRASRAEHYAKALEYVERAMQSATIDPAFREQLRLKQGAWRTAMSEGADDAPAVEPAPAAATAAVDVVTTPEVPPAEDPVLDRELDSAAELEHLEQVVTRASAMDEPADAAVPDESGAP